MLLMHTSALCDHAMCRGSCVGRRSQLSQRVLSWQLANVSWTLRYAARTSEVYDEARSCMPPCAHCACMGLLFTPHSYDPVSITWYPPTLPFPPPHPMQMAAATAAQERVAVQEAELLKRLAALEEEQTEIRKRWVSSYCMPGERTFIMG